MRAKSGNMVRKKVSRSAGSAKSAFHILKMAWVIWFLKKQIGENRSSTLRELYYISEGWKKAKFGAQDESNFLIEDLEILTDMQREAFHLRPEEDGATIFGPIELKEVTRRGERKIHCRDDVGEAGYQIPTNVDTIDFIGHDAKFVIAIETGGMYARLIENGFDEDYQAILVHLKGQPARSTRRVLNRINEQFKLPVVVFTDGDPGHTGFMQVLHTGQLKAPICQKSLPPRRPGLSVYSQVISGTITSLLTTSMNVISQHLTVNFLTRVLQQTTGGSRLICS